MSLFMLTCLLTHISICIYISLTGFINFPFSPIPNLSLIYIIVSSIMYIHYYYTRIRICLYIHYFYLLFLLHITVNMLSFIYIYTNITYSILITILINNIAFTSMPPIIYILYHCTCIHININHSLSYSTLMLIRQVIILTPKH